jgi:hypothetical protein
MPPVALTCLKYASEPKLSVSPICAYGPAGREHEDPLADLRDQGQVVFHQEHAGAAGERGEHHREPLALLFRQPGGGLVEEQQARVGGERAGEFDHPLGLQREAGDLPVRQVPHAQVGQRPGGLRPGLVEPAARDPGRDRRLV